MQGKQMKSLLGQFYSRIKGSQENIASEGLVYVLQNSPAAREALNNFLEANTKIKFNELFFSTQNSGENMERPDISGFDSNGNELLIIEAKFWASLTPNQPIEYIKRMSSNSILMFLCPTLRLQSIYGEVKNRLINARIKFDINEKTHNFYLNNNRIILIKSWNELLEAIRLRLYKTNDHIFLSDIEQIIGLCDAIDTNSFIPFQDDDFSQKIARRINSFFNIADKIVDELKSKKLANTDNLRSTRQRYGYTRYFRIKEYSAVLYVQFDYWAEIADTPFWLEIMGDNFSQDNNIKSKLRVFSSKYSFPTHENKGKKLLFPIYPLVDAIENDVVKNITSKIIYIIDRI
jgi:hypothetical protein